MVILFERTEVECGQGLLSILVQYHSTLGLMQILHFNWQRYQTKNRSRVAKFASFSLVFVSNKYLSVQLAFSNRLFYCLFCLVSSAVVKHIKKKEKEKERVKKGGETISG